MMAHCILPLRIIAQPKGLYRERYVSETDRIHNRGQRFLRAESNPYNLDYPTIEIPNEWKRPNIYIRVTLVTIPTEHAPYVCVHPYPLDTKESDIVRDTERNSLYFLVTSKEFAERRKSFRISCTKLIQYKLKEFTRLRLLNLDEQDVLRTNKPADPRRLIDIYQLGKSQLVFSIAELLHDESFPVTYHATSVFSSTMIAVMPMMHNMHVKCVPNKGDCRGGDRVLMVIPRIDRRKNHRLSFECPTSGTVELVPIEFVDSKTIEFITPRCRLHHSDNQLVEMSIVLTQHGEEIARVQFTYQPANSCNTCGSNLLPHTMDLYEDYK